MQKSSLIGLLSYQLRAHIYAENNRVKVEVLRVKRVHSSYYENQVLFDYNLSICDVSQLSLSNSAKISLVRFQKN